MRGIHVNFFAHVIARVGRTFHASFKRGGLDAHDFGFLEAVRLFDVYIDSGIAGS